MTEQTAQTSQQQNTQQATASKELFAIISLLFFAPLIRKQIKEDDFWFSENDKAYILWYTHKGMMILWYAIVGIVLLAASYLRREPLLHTLSTVLFVIAALSILIGIISVVSRLNQAPLNADQTAITTYSVRDTLRAYLPLFTTRQRYAHIQEQQLITKEGRLLWTWWARIMLLFPTPRVLLSGLIVIMIRAATTLVSGYQYVPLLDKCMVKRSSEPEERAAYPLGLLATSLGIHVRPVIDDSNTSTPKKQIPNETPVSASTWFFDRIKQAHANLSQRYGTLQSPSIGWVFALLLRFAGLAAFGRWQLHTYTDARWFWLAALPYIIIFGRYLLIYILVQRVPYTPLLQDIFWRFTAHAHAHDQVSSTPASTPTKEVA